MEHIKTPKVIQDIEMIKKRRPKPILGRNFNNLCHFFAQWPSQGESKYVCSLNVCQKELIYIQWAQTQRDFSIYI